MGKVYVTVEVFGKEYKGYLEDGWVYFCLHGIRESLPASSVTYKLM